LVGLTKAILEKQINLSTWEGNLGGNNTHRRWKFDDAVIFSFHSFLALFFFFFVADFEEGENVQRKGYSSVFEERL
jgi:hypothetical protein